MRHAWMVGSLGLCLVAGMLVIGLNRADASASSPATAPATAERALPATPATQAAPLAKRCSFNSDCPYGKCKHGKCGGCSFNSDCKGWGKCKGGWCGGCSFNSDCKAFGGCKSGRCKRSPY